MKQLYLHVSAVLKARNPTESDSTTPRTLPADMVESEKYGGLLNNLIDSESSDSKRHQNMFQTKLLVVRYLLDVVRPLPDILLAKICDVRWRH